MARQLGCVQHWLNMCLRLMCHCFCRLLRRGGVCRPPMCRGALFGDLIKGLWRCLSSLGVFVRRLAAAEPRLWRSNHNRGFCLHCSSQPIPEIIFCCSFINRDLVLNQSLRCWNTDGFKKRHRCCLCCHQDAHLWVWHSKSSDHDQQQHSGRIPVDADVFRLLLGLWIFTYTIRFSNRADQTMILNFNVFTVTKSLSFKQIRINKVTKA